MSLSVDSRPCGTVYVLRCTGRIVTGEPISVLEGGFERGLRESTRLVLDLAEVNRVDSTGMGLLVRFLSHARNRGGDLRLSAAPPFVASLLQVTKLATVFRLYETEEQAIVSYLKGSAMVHPAAAAGRKVLFLDQSPDLCAFVRTLLQQHGYDVSSTCRMRDARLLLTADNFEFVVLGPDSSGLPSDNVVLSLKSLAPAATTIQLHEDFKREDAEHASRHLLRMMQGAAQS